MAYQELNSIEGEDANRILDRKDEIIKELGSALASDDEERKKDAAGSYVTMMILQDAADPYSRDTRWLLANFHQISNKEKGYIKQILASDWVPPQTHYILEIALECAG